MDIHYLTPLFRPISDCRFAGQADEPSTQTLLGGLLHAFLRAQTYSGTLQFLNTQASGTLADLAQVKADLAIIALPPKEMAATLGAGQPACTAAPPWCCPAASVPTRPPSCKKVAEREGIHLLGPNCLGLQRPPLATQRQCGGPAGAVSGRWRWCRSRAR